MKSIMIVIAAAGLAGSASAQTSGDSESKKPVENCQVQPDQKDQKAGQPTQPGSNESLTETLNPCDGVLNRPRRAITASPHPRPMLAKRQ